MFTIIDPKKSEFRFAHFVDFDFYQIDPVVYQQENRDKEYLLNLKDFCLKTPENKAIIFGDAYYLDKEFTTIKPILNQISGIGTWGSENQYFKSSLETVTELEGLFKDPGKLDVLIAYSIENNRVIHEECNFEIPTDHRNLPRYEMTPEERSKYATNEDLFWGAIGEGLAKHPELIEQWGEDVVWERIEREYNVITIGNCLDYFLILRDIVFWARRQGILVGLGRGSAGGSLTSYLLGLIQINPLKYDLLFERFLNVGRIQKSLPDIDTDFPAEYRPAIKKYMEERFGSMQVCSVGTYSLLQLRSAIKDFAKINGCNFEDVNRLTTTFLTTTDRSFEDLIRVACSNKQVANFINSYPQMINEITEILGQPRSRSIHACAMMLFPKEKDMFHWVPIRNQDGEFITEWEGMEMDSAGFLKEDILGIKQLSKIQSIISKVRETTGEEIDIYNIPLDDSKVFEYFCSGWCGDVFHFGSKGLTSYCVLMQPKNINDLIAAIALYRPGAMENGFHLDYIQRKNGITPVVFPKGTETILKDTYAVFVYQEDIMRMCQELGGLSLIEADDVRKSMVKKKFEELVKYKERFIENYQRVYFVEEQYARDVWDTIEKAASYLFNKSHATAYAITGYICQWLKVHFPIAYWSTAFSFADEEDFPVYIAEINKTNLGVQVKGVDINKSEEGMVNVGENMYWGLSSIKGLGEKALIQIMEDRTNNGEYFSMFDFIDRHRFVGSKVNKTVIEGLIYSGAFDSLENIKSPIERKDLLCRYREQAKIKVNKNIDAFSKSNQINNNWWWCLAQKKVSGFAWFDFNSLVNQFDPKIFGYPYTDLDSIIGMPEGSPITIAGFVQEFIPKMGKNGAWGRLILENNYRFIYVTIFSSEFRTFNDIITTAEGNLLIVNGVLEKDRNEENYLQINGNSDMTLLVF